MAVDAPDFDDDLQGPRELLVQTSLEANLNMRKRSLHFFFLQRGLNDISKVVELIKKSKKIVVLSGAGVSVSAGVPDFRGANGIYKLVEEYNLVLPSPESLFDIDFFDENPRPFFQFAKNLFPGRIAPSTMHKFLCGLEQSGKLLRNYSQNIDGLEAIAGMERCIPCHGSLTTATCQSNTCSFVCEARAIRKQVLAGEIPICPRKGCAHVVKVLVLFQIHYTSNSKL